MRPYSICNIHLLSDANSETLEKLIMENTVLPFGMVKVVVVDLDIKFLHLFEAIRAALDMILAFGEGQL